LKNISKGSIGDIESGLRGNDWKIVDEHNRKIVDHISDNLFSPTDVSTKNLQVEHVSWRDENSWKHRH